MNNKAQAAGYAMAFMLAVTVIILALAFAKPVNEVTTDSMNATNSIGEVGGMDCNNSSISDFQKAGCLVSDMGQGFFIGGIMAIAGMVIAARVIFG